LSASAQLRSVPLCMYCGFPGHNIIGIFYSQNIESSKAYCSGLMRINWNHLRLKSK